MLGFFSDERPPRGHSGFVDWRLNGVISKQMADGRISGIPLEKVLIASDRRLPASKILLIGLGEIALLTYDGLYQAGYAFSETVAGLRWTDFAFEIPAAGRCSLELPIMAEAVLTGFFDFFSQGTEPESFCPALLARDCDLEAFYAGIERFRKNVGKHIEVEIVK